MMLKHLKLQQLGGLSIACSLIDLTYGGARLITSKDLPDANHRQGV